MYPGVWPSQAGHLSVLRSSTMRPASPAASRARHLTDLKMPRTWDRRRSSTLDSPVTRPVCRVFLMSLPSPLSLLLFIRIACVSQGPNRSTPQSRLLDQDPTSTTLDSPVTHVVCRVFLISVPFDGKSSPFSRLPSPFYQYGLGATSPTSNRPESARNLG